MGKNQRRFVILFALAFLGMVAYGGMVSVHLRYGTLRDGYIIETLAWYALAFVVYVAAIIWVEGSGRFSWQLVWGAAILFRLLLIFTQPTLSDDIYRYLWDGFVANEGVSPYAYAIDDPELDYLEIPERGLANNSWMASPYLPAAQVLFKGLTGLFPLGAIYFQLAAVLFDLLSAWIIGRLLSAVALPPGRILLYLWNPLVIVETAHSAHVDSWMVLLMLLGIWLAVRGEVEGLVPAERRLVDKVLSPVFMGLATLTKILSGFLVPIMVWRWRWWQTVLFGLTTIGLIIPAGLRAGWGLVGPLDGRGLFGALRIYGDSWNFNSGLFHWLELFLGRVGVEADNLWAKLVVGTLMLVVLVWVFLAAGRHRSDWRAVLALSAVPFMAYALLATTVHPWYIHILIVFLPFLPGMLTDWQGGLSSNKLLQIDSGWLLTVPWLYLSGALALSYITYIDPLDFREFEWVRQIEWLPVWMMVCLFGLQIGLLWRNEGRKPFRT